MIPVCEITTKGPRCSAMSQRPRSLRWNSRHSFSFAGALVLIACLYEFGAAFIGSNVRPISENPTASSQTTMLHAAEKIKTSKGTSGSLANLDRSGLLMLLGTVGGASVAMRTKSKNAASEVMAMDRKDEAFELPDSVKQALDSDLLPRVSLMLFALFCSTNFTFVKILEDGHSEAAVQCVRFVFAALPFLPIAGQHCNKQSIVSGVEIGLWCTLGYVTQAFGLPHTEASKGAFLCSLTMLVVPLVKSFFGAKVSAQTWAAVALAVGGTSLLLGVGGDGSGLTTSFGFGETLCTATALGFGLMFARMDEYGKEPGFSSMGCTVWQVITLAVTMTTWLFLTSTSSEAFSEISSILTSGPDVLGIFAWVSIVTTAGVLFVETWAMEKVDGTEAGVIFASEPVWATIFASVVLGEKFGVQEGLGGALIVLACLLTQVKFENVTAKDQKPVVDGV
eukprot:TRINITY_DN56269_c0_g1_i1.p1 TRINITY_DN56269_c0_g1~~TRINITY_DN56269_c0_g1_i1.p1  ORF type:complete len:451 (-),score=69.99 TRINITY_DN56269_c0_g1_i1:365-1717(-)